MGELVTLSWSSHHQELSDGLWNLYLQNFHTDLEISTLGNEEILQKAHRLLLYVFCPSILRENTHKVCFNNVLTDDISYLVEFMYRGKVEIEERRLNGLKSAAEEVGFKALEDVIDKHLRRNNKKIHNNINDKDDEIPMSKRKAKKPMKIPRSDNKNTIGRQQQQKRRRKIAKNNYCESSDEDEEEDIAIEEESDLIVNGEKIERQKSRQSKKSVDDKLPPLCDTEELLCKVCDKKFKTKQTFRQHMRRHTYPDIIQQCPHCPFKAYNFKSKLFYHLASKHQMDLQGNLLEKNFKCQECDFSCVAEFQLKSHKIYKHGAKIHKCDVCSYASNSRADLRKHQDGVHGNKRPFICETCGFAAKSSSNLHLHLSTHKEKVVCEVCGVTVKCRGLSLHMQTVHGENRKPFHCHLCSLSTRCKFNLKVHLTRVHKLNSDEVKNLLVKNLQVSTDVEAPIMTLEQTIDPNLNLPFLPYVSDTHM
ncbi:hypothetical protein CHUAL_012119 [Chamberlinius hualienensis]